MYTIKVIKESEMKHLEQFEVGTYDTVLFDANMTSDETVEVLNHLWSLRNAKNECSKCKD